MEELQSKNFACFEVNYETSIR